MCRKLVIILRLVEKLWQISRVFFGTCAQKVYDARNFAECMFILPCLYDMSEVINKNTIQCTGFWKKIFWGSIICMLFHDMYDFKNFSFSKSPTTQVIISHLFFMVLETFEQMCPKWGILKRSIKSFLLRYDIS